MARYTFTIRELCNIYGQDEIQSWFEDYDFTRYLTKEQISVIEETGIFDKKYLSRMIIEHYYVRESGLETPALFKRKAGVKMREIMCRYAPMIYSAAIKFDPLVNVDYTETFSRQTSGDSTTSTDGTGLSINSDTPQGKIDKKEILKGNYATSTSANEAQSTSSDTSTGKEDYTRKTKGNSGVSATAQALIKQYRDVIAPINYDIINDIEDLFLSIY